MNLEKRLKVLAEENDLSDLPNVASEVQSIKRELSEIMQEKANKAIFKAKAHWMQVGERPSSYFLGLEKRKSKEKCISTVKNDSGTILTDSSEILAYQKKYFSDIYHEDVSQLQPITDMEDLLNFEDDLPRFHRDMINTPFTPQEFYVALKDLNNNKKPWLRWHNIRVL